MQAVQTKKTVKIVFFSIVFTILLSIVFHVFSVKYIFVIAKSQPKCLPQTFWIVKKGVKNLKEGDYIAFSGKNIPYFQDGIKWVKVVIATEGAIVNVTTIPEDKRHFETVKVNNMPMNIKVQGYVFIRANNNKVVYSMRVFERDTKFRPVPMIKEQVIPSGKYFVWTPHERSFDSRYWGLVDESQVIGKAYPIF